MKLDLALCQMNIAWEDPAANLDHLKRMLDGTELKKNSLVVLPEAFGTGFSMNAGVVWKGSELIQRTLKGLATERKICFLAGVASRSGNNAVLIAANGGVIGIYSKIHPFTPAGEHRIFPQGKSICTFDFGGIKLTPFICYDLRFPEIFRQASAGGTELYVVIANWPAARDDHWKTLLTARAIENQAYVVGVNRLGADPSVEYCGSSMVIGPSGELIVEPTNVEGLTQCCIDIDEVSKARDAFPALKDRKFE